MLSRAELAAAGRRKLEEFRKQKAAGQAGRTAPGAPQQPEAAVPPLAAPPPPAYEQAPFVTTGSSSLSGAANAGVLHFDKRQSAWQDGATASTRPSLPLVPPPEPAMARAAVGQPPTATAEGGQDGATGSRSASPDPLGGYQRRLPPPMPTYTWQPPQRSTAPAEAAKNEQLAASPVQPARPPLPPSPQQEESSAVASDGPPAQGGSMHSSAGAASSPGGDGEGGNSVAGSGGGGSSRGGLFGSFGSLFGSAALPPQTAAPAAADTAAVASGQMSGGRVSLDSSNVHGSLGGRPNWMQPAAAEASSSPSWQQQQQRQQQQPQQQQQAAAGAGDSASAAPAVAASSWATGYAALSDAYALPSKEPAALVGAALPPPAAAAQRLFDGSGSGAGTASTGANGMAAPLGTSSSGLATAPLAAATAAPDGVPAASSAMDSLTSPAAAAASVGSGGAGGGAGASPAHSRQPSDASAVSSLLAPSSLASGGGGLAAPAGAAGGASRPAGHLPTSGSVGMFGAPQSRAQEFKALQQHIDDLTEEKFMLQRGMEQQAKLAESLLEENEAMARRHNEQAAEVEQLQRQVRELQQLLASQAAAVDAAHAERDAYKLSAQELQERSKSLAAEVVALEEQVLQLKSSHLKDRSQASGASEVARAMQAQLEAVSKERGTLLDEVHRLREESAEARHTIKRLQQQQAEAAAAAAAVVAQQAQAQQQGQQGEVADGKQQEPVGAQHEYQVAAMPVAQGAAAEEAVEQERQRLRQEHAAEVARLQTELSLAHRQNAELQQQLAHVQAQPGAAAGAAAAGGREQLSVSLAASAAATPTASASLAGPAVSAFISQTALLEAAERDQQPAAAQHAQQAQQAGSLPPELAALLPAALYSLPSAGPGSGGSGLAGGEAALQLTNSIYLLLDALEEDKRHVVAALNAKQEELESELRARQALEQKLAAQQRRLELAQQQQQADGSSGSANGG